MKLVTIDATFPELKSGSMYKTGRGEATNWPAALSRAAKDLHKQLRGKHVHTIKAVITIIDVEKKTPLTI